MKREAAKKFESIFPEKLLPAEDNKFYQKVKILINQYSKNISSAFSCQFTSLRGFVQYQQTNLTSNWQNY